MVLVPILFESQRLSSLAFDNQSEHTIGTQEFISI